MANRYEMLRRKYMKETITSDIIEFGAKSFRYLTTFDAHKQIGNGITMLKNAKHFASTGNTLTANIVSRTGKQVLSSGITKGLTQGGVVFAGGTGVYQTVNMICSNNVENIPTEESAQEVISDIAAPEVSAGLSVDKLQNMISKFDVAQAHDIVQKNSRITEETVDKLYIGMQKEYGNDPAFAKVKESYLHFKQVLSEEMMLDANAKLYVNIFLAGVLLIVAGLIISSVMPKAAYESVSYTQIKKNRYMREGAGDTGVISYFVNAIAGFFKWIINTPGNFAISLGILLCVCSAGLLLHQMVSTGQIGMGQMA